jgi:hypothetical protein
MSGCAGGTASDDLLEELQEAMARWRDGQEFSAYAPVARA